MGTTAQQRLTRATATLLWTQRTQLSAAVGLRGYVDSEAEYASRLIVEQARRLGFAVTSGAPRSDPHGSRRSLLLDALASVVQLRGQGAKPLLLDIGRLDRSDVVSAQSARFLAARLAREAVVWLVAIDPSTSGEADPVLMSGPAVPVLSQALAVVGTASGHDGVHGLLTPAELQVAELVCAGSSNAAVARTLGVSTNTVGTHLRSVYAKLQVRSRVQLVNAMRPGQATG